MSEIKVNTAKGTFARATSEPRGKCVFCKIPTGRVIAHLAVHGVQWAILHVCNDCFTDMCRLYQKIEETSGIAVDDAKIYLPD